MKRAPLAIALAVALLAAGCGGGGDEFPTGRWTAGISGVGIVVTDYRPDGTWALSYGPSMDNLTEGTSGLYSTTGDTITFETDAYCKAERPHVEQGTYAWTLDEQGRLTLTVRYDPCPDRMRLIDGVVYRPTG